MRKFLSVVFILFSIIPSFAAIWTVVDAGLTFSSDSITITQDDTVNFVLSGTHNAQEVDQSTWNANINTPITGFATPFTGGMVTGLSVGTHYYVCVNHSGSGMKGRIFVQPAPPKVEFVVTSSTRSEGVGSFGIAVSITNPNANPTSVDVNVVNGGTATSGFDFTYSPVTITFPGGSQVAEIITVNIADDQIAEGIESFTFQLAFPTNGASVGMNAQHTVIIADNDTLQIGFTSASLSQFENIGQVNLPVQLTKISPNATSVTVHFINSGSTAVQGTDFMFNDTTITWGPNTANIIFVPVNVVDDAITEPDETVRFQLINPNNDAILVSDTFLLVIQNNDTQAVPPATIRFTTAGNTVPESSGPVRVVAEVNNPTNVPVTYIIARNDAASTADIVLDYTYPNAQFTHGAGISYDTIYLHPINEQLIEPAETAVLNLIPVSSNASFIADSIYTLTIIDNDTLSVSFNGAGFSYVEDTGWVQVRVNISSPVSDTTKVSVKLAPGNAVKGVDFNFNDTTLVFLPNSIDTQAFWVQIKDDTIVESNEQINFDLHSPTNDARFGIAAYTLTIIDNDSPNGIDELGLTAGIKMYPNPVTNTLFVQSEMDWNDIVITDLLGNTVMIIGRLSSGKNTVDVSALSAGMYLIALREEHRFLGKRFVKQD